MVRLLLGGMILIFTYLQIKLWCRQDGMSGAFKARQQLHLITRELDQLQRRNQSLQSELMFLKSHPEAIEEHARVVFGMTKSKETFYRVIEEPMETV